MSEEKTQGSNMGFSKWLTLTFIVLKLCHVIDWSWWWITSPFWIMIILVLITNVNKENKKP